MTTTVRNKTKSHAAIFKTYLVLMLASLVVLAVQAAPTSGRQSARLTECCFTS